MGFSYLKESIKKKIKHTDFKSVMFFSHKFKQCQWPCGYEHANLIIHNAQNFQFLNKQILNAY